MTSTARIAALLAACLLSLEVSAGPLVRIEVVPASTTVGPGETQAYSAIGYDDAGQVVEVAPNWAVSGGTIDAAGLYTAPATGGDHRVEASASGVVGVATVAVTGTPTLWPNPTWQTATPADADLDAALLDRARDYALRGGGSGFIVRGGRRVYAWGDPNLRYDVKSVTKSIGGTALGLALADGRVRLEDAAQSHLPIFGLPPDSNAGTGWLDDVTLAQLASHTAGFEKPGGYVPITHAPGTRWAYSDGGANWLADVLTEVYAQDLRDLLFGRVLMRIGVTAADLSWRSSVMREDTLNGIKRRELAAGISVSVDAMARVGYLYLRRGRWSDERLLPESFIRLIERPWPAARGLPVVNEVEFAGASNRNGVLWWTNVDGALAGVPREAFWAWGLGDHLIVVIPSLDMVIARAGDAWRSGGWSPDYEVLEPFLTPIVDAVQDNAAPLVNAGADLSLTLPTVEATLKGTASDDGRPRAGTLTAAWSVVDGAAVAIATPDALETAVVFPGAGTYTLRLTVNDGAASASDELIATVVAPPPRLTFEASSARVVAGSAVSLSWKAEHADRCTASSGWSGEKPAAGSETVTVAATATYTLDCAGPSGTTKSSVTVTADPPGGGGDGGGGGGGGGGGALGGLALCVLALARLRRLRRLSASF